LKIKNLLNVKKKRTFDEKDRYIKIFNENNKIIKENINKVTYIDCSLYWIINIKGIFIFKNLKVLNLIGNKIQKLPKEIEKLEKLKEIDLSYNQLLTLPEGIERLENLEILYLKNNYIKNLSNKIGNLKNLKKLDLKENQLHFLPKEIEKLKELKEINLKNNKIKELSNKIWMLIII